MVELLKCEKSEVAMSLFDQIRRFTPGWVCVRIRGDAFWEVVQPRSQKAVLEAMNTRPPITDEAIERGARAICKSDRFDTGEGTCAVLCMEFLGSPRKSGCAHASRIHGHTARLAITAFIGGDDA